ncbi:MAG TPA: mersacidin/lichenicidin family type 2 lantibiotic [Thermoanaerobaculia bacterium]|nr:mersacidin/lichenicidin family type 2 lantibiotic [Thermoanaerobaculia bacterium]
MNRVDIVRAWKDPLYRASLTAEERDGLPGHPSGLMELEDELLKSVAAGALTTAQQCTEFSFNNFRRCCPK